VRIAALALLVLALCATVVATRPDGEPRRPTPAAAAPTAVEPAFVRAAEATGAIRRYTLPPDRTRRGNAFRPRPGATPREARAQRWEAGLAHFLHERR
jgi:hypothetical protein